MLPEVRRKTFAGTAVDGALNFADVMSITKRIFELFELTC
jgi:hypothetical protein